ncbi:beta-ketoacyl-[acyl-carrier-protein] synthase family protein [Isoptericola sp. NEAU-Y5]|uniref:Beta-ketoacyl-[acyl-carrier-protein] synthase family protein n=1 Tax=Isoptericola luteus TaxID=2879484 RepID=A0ABS7ZJN0_9MICO|nr:beta-ketoacyl-[acyl-carrier-protein] synthase family protein [Isoptericola sp. NEAU-Y5]MCA5894561.1 beta-ketoacyl-[acyl-carrier-protein] synthase family protein [Isoptericola sp. NEAU-Y5]
MRRTVITGVGAVTPVGLTAEQSWAGLVAGTNAVTPLADAWAQELPVRIAARVDDAFADALSVRELRRLDRGEQLAVAAGREAWASAGAPEVEPERLGVVVGTANGGFGTTLAQHVRLQTGGHRQVSPHAVTMVMCNGPAAWVSIDLGAKAGARAPVSACAAGTEAILTARSMIRAGEADVVVCGGTEATIVDLCISAFARARAMSTRNDEPGRASRPFDAGRDGFVMGEGAVLFVLEAEEHARARGATVLGAVDGAVLTSDAHDIVGGEPTNQARTIELAIRDAGLEPADVGLVHAHATSTPSGDLNEARALRSVFGDPPPVTATKASTGHLLGASGALGALAALFAMRDGVVPPTLNLDEQDPEVGLDVVTASRGTSARHALVDAFGFGGHSSALVLSRS